MKPARFIIPALFIAFIAFILFAPDGQQRPGNKGTSTPGISSLVNSPAPTFKLTDTKGTLWQLEALKGKVILINFWATWCPPCREEMPSLSEMFKNTIEFDDFVILTVLYQDDPDSARSYFKENGFSMPIVLDPDSTMARDYGLTGVPETFFIDKSGRVRKHIIGPTNFSIPAAAAFVDNLRKDQPLLTSQSIQ